MRVSSTIAAVLLLACAGCARSPEDWRAELRNKDPFERGLAALALARIAPAESAEALPRLLELVDGNDEALAAAARVEMAQLARHQVPLLIKNLVEVEGASPDFRSALRAALVAAGADAVGPLRAHLLDRGASNPREMGQILADIGPGAVAPLIEDLADPDALRRVCTAWTLARIGREAGSAAPALTGMLERDELPVARQAALSLAQVAPLDEATATTLERQFERRPELAPALREALARLALKRVRLDSREEIGPRLFALGAEAFVPAVEACGEREPQAAAIAARYLCLRYAALALGLDPGLSDARRTAQRLQADLDDRDPGTRARATFEIARLGQGAADFAPELAARTRDKHAGVALCARLALLHVLRSLALEGARRRP